MCTVENLVQLSYHLKIRTLDPGNNNNDDDNNNNNNNNNNHLKIVQKIYKRHAW